MSTGFDSSSCAESEKIFFSFAGVTGNNDVVVTLDLFDGNVTFDFADDGERLGLSCFEELFNTGKTLCDVRTGSNTAGMEGSHRKLCTRFTDRLSGDDADCFTDGDRLAGCKVRAVALDAGTVA